MNRPVHHEKLLIRDKSALVLYCILTLTELAFFMFYMKKLHYWHGDVLNVKQNIVSKGFLESFGPGIYKTLIKR